MMKRAWQVVLVVVALLVTPLAAFGQATATQSPLPNGMQQFADGNGVPYAGASVYFYVPGTTSPKGTWKDPNQQAANQNPVILDANGRATIWGSGLYRQVLRDQYGNTIWDQLTSAQGASTTSGASWLTCASASTSGSGNAQVLTPSVPVTSLVVGNVFCGLAGYANTGPATLKVSSLAPFAILRQTANGLKPLVGGEITVGQGYQWMWDGLEYQLLNPSPSGVTSVNVMAFGAKGDGTTDDTGAFNSAFAAATSALRAGGQVIVPCGVYKLSKTLNVNVPASQHLTVDGGGQDCTELWFASAGGNANDGIIVNYGDLFSSVEVNRLAITTDGTGYGDGLKLMQENYQKDTSGASVQGSLIYGPNNDFYGLLFRGHDFYQPINYPAGGGTPTTRAAAYWLIGMYEEGVSNINVWGGGYNAPFNLYKGTGYSVNGLTGAASYTAVFNMFGTNINNCGWGLYYGDYVQGVTMTSVNITNCKDAINTTSLTISNLDELNIVNSQFNTTVCGVCWNSTKSDNVAISNSLFITAPGSVTLKLAGTFNEITGNTFGGEADPTTGNPIAGTQAIRFTTNALGGQGSIVTGNIFSGYDVAIVVAQNISSQARIGFNTFDANNNDYQIGTGSSGTQINDTMPRGLAGLPTCVATGTGGTVPSGIIWSRFLQVDSNAGSGGYNAPATSGGAEVNPVVCNGSAWHNH